MIDMAKKTHEPEETGTTMEAMEPSTEAAPMPAAETAAQAKKDTDKRCEAGFWAYIGPTLPGLLQHGAILPGSRADALQAAAAAVEKQPLVKTLIVSGDSLPQDRLRAKTPGTALYNACRRIAGKM